MNLTGLRSLLKEACRAGISTPSYAGFEFLRSAVTDKGISDELLKHFKEDDNFQLFDNKMLNMGSGWSSATLDNLVQWSLWTSNIEGVDTVIERLDRYLRLDYSPAIRILVISGLDIDKRIELSNGISLIPLSMLPPSQIRNVIDPPHLKPEALLRHYGPSLPYLERLRHAPTAALVKQVKLRPKSSKEAVEQSTLSDPELDEICECLTLLNSTCAAIPLVSWCELEDWTPLYGFMGGAWIGTIHDVLNSSSYKFSQEDEVTIKSIVCSFKAINKNTRDKLKIPIKRLNQARRRNDLADKAIELGIAFESLYCSDSEQNEQISLTFRLRAAWFLGDAANREVLIDKFRAIYKARSVAVHTGKLPPSIKIQGIGHIPTQDFLKEADELCVMSIRRIIEQGVFPDWNKTILGLN